MYIIGLFATMLSALEISFAQQLVKTSENCRLYISWTHSPFQDAKYYLKTHFQNLVQNEHSVRTGTIGKQTIKPAAPQTEKKQEKPRTQEVSRTPEAPTTSKVVDQSLREKHERRKQKEMDRAKQLDDSDNEQNYEVERQKRKQEEENRRIRKKREAEARRRSEEIQSRQQDYGTGTRQVKGQNVDDRNKNCSATQNCRYVQVVGSEIVVLIGPKMWKTDIFKRFICLLNSRY